MKQGIYPNLSNEEYHADAAISRSGIMMFLDSPYKYWANYINPNRPQREETSAMRFGSAFHTFILEPHLFNTIYAVLPNKVLLKDVGRDAYEEYKCIVEELETSDAIILKHEEMESILEMSAAIEKHPQAKDLIMGAVYERSYFWQDKDSGINCKARPDILHDTMIIDLKTCASASSRAYQRAMIDSGYHIQGAMIREGIREITGTDIPNVINICVEKTYPYSIGIKIIGESALDAGLKKFKQVLVDLRFALEHNTFADYSTEIVEMPKWAE